MEIATKNPQQISEFTEKELVTALQEGNTLRLRLIQSQFFEKFKGYVFGAALNRTKTYPDSEDFAADIVQLTFISVFKSIKQFSASQAVSDVEYNKRLKGWLGKIANNHFNKQYAIRLKTIPIDEINLLLPEPTYDLFRIMYDPEVEVPNGFRIALEKAFATIQSDRDKHIITEYAREGCIESKQHLSQASIDFLCKLHNITPDYLHKIKRRTLEKIKQHCFRTFNE